MVAGQEEEGHLQLMHEADELVPLLIEFGPVFAVALDQVADAHDELGLEQVELAHGLREDAGPVAARSIADDGELKRVGIAAELQMRPRVGAVLLLDCQGALCRALGGEGATVGRHEQRQCQATPVQTLHGFVRANEEDRVEPVPAWDRNPFPATRQGGARVAWATTARSFDFPAWEV